MAELNGLAVDVAALASLALTNYGHFTTMRVDDGRVRGLALHLERLRRDCRELFGADLDTDLVRHLVRRLTGDAPVLARVTVFDPALDLGHPATATDPRILVTTRPVGAGTPPPSRVLAAPFRRERPLIKHTGLFAALHLRRRAQLDGYDDVVFTDGPHLTEGVTWNVGFLDGDRVVWPRAEVLPGVTMALLNRDGSTEPVRLAELARFTAAFATNAAVGVRPIASIDATTWPVDHPALVRLRAEYDRIPADPL